MPTPDAMIQVLWDKQAITEKLYMYCRGVDRTDRAALESAYWPDATDDHIKYVGTAAGAIDYTLEACKKMRTHHMLGNVLIDLVSATEARAESYVHAYHEMEGPLGAQEMIFAARYLDRFEKRGEEWRIAHRKVVMDYYKTAAATANWEAGRYLKGPSRGEKTPDDPLYALLGGRL